MRASRGGIELGKVFACAAVALGTTALGACISDQAPGGGDGDLTSVASQLLQTGNKWPNGQVPVCWDQASIPFFPLNQRDPTFDVDSKFAQERARVTWSHAAKIDFTGWDTCPANPRGMLVMHLYNDSGGCTCKTKVCACNDPASGYPGPFTNVYIHLGRQRPDWNAAAPHELGHALGFAHDIERDDFPGPSTGCVSDHPVVSGNKLDTPFDPTSIMSESYCPNGSQILSFWDIWGAQIFYGARPSPMVPLAAAHSNSRNDYVTVSIGAGRLDTDAAGGYDWTMPVGWVFSASTPAPETVPLLLYWSDARQDNVTVATPEGIHDAEVAGYRLVRTEGYVYPTKRPGTSQLILYWNDALKDNLTTTATIVPPGYVAWRTEGFIYTSDRQASWIGPISDEQAETGGRCPGNGFAVLGAGCKGGYCDDMMLWCSPPMFGSTAVPTSPDSPDMWSTWISEETTPYQHNGHPVDGNTIGCENDAWGPKPVSKVIDGIRALGDNSDDISIHCATLSGTRQVDGGTCRWTTPFSEEQAWQIFPTANPVAVAVRCAGSKCDNLSFLTCALK